MGAGGVLGGAWLTGALNAIASETGWDPGSADYIVGTSAGAMLGALIACGVPPWLMLAHSAGEQIDGLRDARGGLVSDADRSGGAEFRLHRGLPLPLPGSWRMALRTLARAGEHSPAALVAGWLPRGLLSTESLKDTVRRACDEPWAPHPNFWPVAVDYQTGRRVVFGRRGAPRAELADAVAASCAIPGIFQPVRIGGRHYIDGGVHSTSNIEVLARRKLEMVVVLNPMSSLHSGVARSLGERAALAMRAAAGRRLGNEAKRMRAAGTEVVLIQPTASDLEVMGSNLMNRSRRNAVIETAVQTVGEHLRRSAEGELLFSLPSGAPEMVRRPAGRLRADLLMEARARNARDRITSRPLSEGAKLTAAA